MLQSGALPREPIEGRLRARPMPDPRAVVTAGLHELPLPSATHALLRVPDAGDGRVLPLVVMLHGSGAQAQHGIDLVAEQADARSIVVLAPKSSSYTWDLLVGGLGADVAAIDEALAQVFLRCPIDPERIAVGGFSDGASYALSLGLANGDLFSHVLAFSPGFLAPPMLVGRPSIFVSHGVDDEVLRIGATSRRLVPELREAAYDVDYEEFAGGHSVPSSIVARGLDALTAC